MDAVIIDLDGTLMQSRRSRDFIDPSTGQADMSAWLESTRFSPVNEWCSSLVHAMNSQGAQIIFLTARHDGERAQEITREWLENFGFGYISYKLFMRDADDSRMDPDVKRDIFLQKIAPYYNVLFAIDDKSGVINMWRDVGVTALHCANY